MTVMVLCQRAHWEMHWDLIQTANQSQSFNKCRHACPSYDICYRSCTSLRLKTTIININQLNECLQALEWPCCNCSHYEMFCHSATPGWVGSYGTQHPVLRCLNLSMLPMHENTFHQGIQNSFSDFIDKGDNQFIGILEDVLNSTTSLHTAISAIQEIVGVTGYAFKAYISGYLCGAVVYDMNTKWAKLRAHCRNDKARREALLVWFESITSLITTGKRNHEWLIRTESLRDSARFNVVIASMFWLIQWAMYLVEDLKLLASSTWSEAETLHNSGLLVWQQGWLQTDETVCAMVAKIMFRFQ